MEFDKEIEKTLREFQKMRLGLGNRMGSGEGRSESLKTYKPKDKSRSKGRTENFRVETKNLGR